MARFGLLTTGILEGGMDRVFRYFCDCQNRNHPILGVAHLNARFGQGNAPIYELAHQVTGTVLASVSASSKLGKSKPSSFRVIPPMSLRSMK